MFAFGNKFVVTLPVTLKSFVTRLPEIDAFPANKFEEIFAFVELMFDVSIETFTLMLFAVIVEFAKIVLEIIDVLAFTKFALKFALKFTFDTLSIVFGKSITKT